MGDVVDLFLVRGFFFPVAVAPLVDPLRDKEACRGGDGYYADQSQVQPGQKGQVEHKTRQIEQEIGQGGPDVFRRPGIAPDGVLRFLKQFEDLRVPGVGIGGRTGFFVQIIDDRDSQPHPAEHGVLVHIAEQAVQEDQRQGKASDGPQQPGQGSMGLHLGQDDRRDEQLGQVDAQGKRRKQHAQGQDVLALAPGQRQHEPDVLPDAVLWFCFHKAVHLISGVL